MKNILFAAMAASLIAGSAMARPLTSDEQMEFDISHKSAVEQMEKFAEGSPYIDAYIQKQVDRAITKNCSPGYSDECMTFSTRKAVEKAEARIEMMRANAVDKHDKLEDWKTSILELQVDGDIY